MANYDSVCDDEAQSFWASPFSTGHARDQVAKYTSLLELASMSPGANRAERLRAVAKRWPAALREAELVGPRVCAARREEIVVSLDSAPAQPSSVGRPRAVWRAAGLAFAPLWVELHGLIVDQLRWRATQPRERSLDAFVDALSTSARARWLPAARLCTLAGPRLTIGHAYACLAARSGLDNATMRAELFAGHPQAGPKWSRDP